ncbi:hypothetical protein ACVV39_01080 [Escherichia coli]
MLPEVKPETASARPYKQTHATLDREIACALLPVAPEKITPSILKAADEIISQDREDFKRWSMALRTTDQILAYDRASVFGVIQSAPAKDTYHFPQSLRSHIDNWLQANGQRDANAVEEKPKEAAPKDDVKVTNHGGGRFSIDGMMSETPSNQGEKAKLQMLENVVCSSCVSSLSRLAMCMTYLKITPYHRGTCSYYPGRRDSSTRTT